MTTNFRDKAREILQGKIQFTHDNGDKIAILPDAAIDALAALHYEEIKTAESKAELYGRMNEHHVIADRLTREEHEVVRHRLSPRFQELRKMRDDQAR